MESGTAGAMFETVPIPGAELVDFVFKTTGGQANVRYERRTAQCIAGNSYEFQIGPADASWARIGNASLVTTTPIVLPADPVAALHAAPKQYVDALVAAHAGAVDPHAVYLLTSEGDARYATPASITSAITAHEALANPHGIYLTQTEADSLYTPVAHTSAPDPHPVYLTQSEGDGRYTQGGQTQAQADARYLQLTGGTLSGDLILSEATPLLSLKQVADTQPRARLTDLGLYFGPGGATVLDTSLLRTGANALSLGGSPVITQTLGDARYATPANITSAITTHEGLADPHPTYTTATELSTAISNHAGLADPHPTYLTSTEGNAAYATPASVTSAITAHEALANPHGIDSTQAEADALYQAIGTYLTQATGDARYLQLVGGTATGLITLHAAAVGTTVLQAKLPADTQPRGLWRADGYLGWGPGGATGFDTALYRSAAQTLSIIGALLPNATATRDLGTTALRWAKLWATNAELTTALVVASKAVALDPLAGNTLAWNAAGFYSNSPTKAQYDALLARVAALEAQMGAGVNGHYHLMGTWQQTQKATLPSTVLEREEAPAT